MDQLINNPVVQSFIIRSMKAQKEAVSAMIEMAEQLPKEDFIEVLKFSEKQSEEGIQYMEETFKEAKNTNLPLSTY